MSFIRRFASWLVMAAMLIALPPSALGHYQCSLGMSQAGPACPRCHGELNAPAAGPSVNGNCCKYIESANAATAEVAPSLSRFTPSVASALHLATPADRFSLAPGQEISWRPLHDRGAPSTLSPLYLSNFLRL